MPKSLILLGIELLEITGLFKGCMWVFWFETKLGDKYNIIQSPQDIGTLYRNTLISKQ